MLLAFSQLIYAEVEDITIWLLCKSYFVGAIKLRNKWSTFAERQSGYKQQISEFIILDITR